jgi:hypothetical protein
MRVRLVIAALLALVVFGSLEVSGADAGRRLSYGQATQETRRHARGVCREATECIGSAAGRCRRRSPRRIDCVMVILYPDSELPEEEIQCNTVLRWGVRGGGRIVLRGSGRQRCFGREQGTAR